MKESRITKESSKLPPLIFGVTYPVGNPTSEFVKCLKGLLETKYNYELEVIKVTDIIDNTNADDSAKKSFSYYKKMMDKGDRLRKEDPSILAKSCIEKIRKQRSKKNRAFLVSSLKRPEEVELLRKVYGDSFYLFGLSSEERDRISALTEKMSKEDAKKLILRDYYDSGKKKKFGQRVRDTYILSDFFINTSKEFQSELMRFLDIMFSYPYHFPNPEEHFMYLAYASSLVTGDLSRQVGAVIVGKNGNLVSIGKNEVPKYGGGQYNNYDDKENGRDYRRGQDPNKEHINKIKEDIINELNTDAKGELDIGRISSILESSALSDLTEFGRIVHAEMEAILSALRNGINLEGATLYCTTFPCHNCAKHIVGSGISTVFYIEPYDKSKALVLHSDSIKFGYQSSDDSIVCFSPYFGIGPRRFQQFFNFTERKNSTTGKVFNEDEIKERQKLRYFRELEVIKTFEKILGISADAVKVPTLKASLNKKQQQQKLNKVKNKKSKKVHSKVKKNA